MINMEQLRVSALSGNIEYISNEMNNGFNINTPFVNGKTLIFYATVGKQYALIDFLVENGANLHILDNSGYSLLMSSVYTGDINIVSFYLQFGLDSNIKDANGETCLLIASSFGYLDIVELLLEYKQLEIDHKNTKGYNALMMAVSFGYIKIVKLLLKKGANPLIKAPFDVDMERLTDNLWIKKMVRQEPLLIVN